MLIYDYYELIGFSKIDTLFSALSQANPYSFPFCLIGAEVHSPSALNLIPDIFLSPNWISNVMFQLASDFTELVSRTGWISPTLAHLISLTFIQG